MDGYSVELILCSDTLNNLVSKDKYSNFLRFLVNEIYDTKAVVLLEDWQEFFKKWNEQLATASDEIKEPFFSLIKGIVTPYREKYAEEAQINTEPIPEGTKIERLAKIATRHYATVKFLIVQNTTEFKSIENIRLDNSQIVTPKELFNYFEVNNQDILKQFNEFLDKQFL